MLCRYTQYRLRQKPSRPVLTLVVLRAVLCTHSPFRSVSFFFFFYMSSVIHRIIFSFTKLRYRGIAVSRYCCARRTPMTCALHSNLWPRKAFVLVDSKSVRARVQCRKTEDACRIHNVVISLRFT